MFKYIKTIGHFDIVQEAEWDMDRFYYIIRNKGMDVDMFTSLEKAEQFIKEVLQKYNGE